MPDRQPITARSVQHPDVAQDHVVPTLWWRVRFSAQPAFCTSAYSQSLVDRCSVANYQTQGLVCRKISDAGTKYYWFFCVACYDVYPTRYYLARAICAGRLASSCSRMLAACCLPLVALWQRVVSPSQQRSDQCWGFIETWTEPKARTIFRLLRPPTLFESGCLTPLY